MIKYFIRNALLISFVFFIYFLFAYQTAHSQSRTLNIYLTDTNEYAVNNATIVLSAQHFGFSIQEQAVFRGEGLYTIRISAELMDKEFDIDISSSTIVPFRRSIYWSGEQRLSITATASPSRYFLLQAQDSRGQRIDNAFITLESLEHQNIDVITAVTIGNGHYRARLPESLLGTRFNVKGIIQGFEPLNSVFSWEGETSHTLTFQRDAVQQRALIVNITDDKRQPVSGAQATVTIAGREYSPVSHRSGGYRFLFPADVVGKAMSISAKAENFRPISKEQRYNGEEQITINLDPLVAEYVNFIVAIEDEGKQKIPHANVYIRYGYDEYTPEHTSNGEYTFRLPQNLIGRQIIVDAAARSFNTVQRTYHWQGESMYRIELSEPVIAGTGSTRQLTIMVVGEDNRPVENANLMLQPSRGTSRDAIEPISKGRGQYIFRSERFQNEQEFILEVHALNYEFRREWLTLSGRDEYTVQLDRSGITAVPQQRRETTPQPPPQRSQSVQRERNTLFLSASYIQPGYHDERMESLFSGSHGYTVGFHTFSNFIMAGFDVWRIDGEAPYNVGSFSQTGAVGDIGLVINIPIGVIDLDIFGGGGLVYHIFELTDKTGYWEETIERRGYGYSLFGGAQLIINNTFGGFVQFRRTNAMINKLEVGWEGVQFGIKIGI